MRNVALTTGSTSALQIRPSIVSIAQVAFAAADLALSEGYGFKALKVPVFQLNSTFALVEIVTFPCSRIPAVSL